jgi:hypothetical protein
MDLSDEGWWALDFAGYLLSGTEHLQRIHPSALSVASICDWIRQTELPWAPGTTDLDGCPWSIIASSTDEVSLVDSVMELANEEYWRLRELEKLPEGHGTPIDLIARRRIPETTLRAYDKGSMDLTTHSDQIADAHVHQGATLPVEVTLHWVANRLVTFSDDREEIRRLRVVGEDVWFDPLPLLFVLRAIREGQPGWKDGLRLARLAALAPEKGDEWSELAKCLSFDGADEQVFDLQDILRMKREARDDWDGERRIAMLKVEGLLYGAIVQQSPGLDIFVDLFEDFSSLRRGRLPKELYFEKSIEVHRRRTPDLQALELRLGETVFAKEAPRAGALAADFQAALGGYLAFATGKDRSLRVTFPMGFVKTRPKDYPTPQQWRFDPTVIYGLTESLIDLLEDCPELTPFVDGIDVCGNEVDVPNWLFAPAYQRLAEWSMQKEWPLTFRFHAGEWQSTPVHGLRRIAEFADFELPRGMVKRLGHGLALSSQDWMRLGSQPLDELLDDLLWIRRRLRGADGPRDLVRLTEREIADLARLVYPDLDGEMRLADLEQAFDARTDPAALRRIGFMDRSPRLGFRDGRPTPGNRRIDQLMVAHMGLRKEEIPTIAEHVESGSYGDLERLRLLLADAYDILLGEIFDDLRWRSIVVETCPTSNVIVGGVRGFNRHPLGEMMRRGLLTVFGSDDPSLFHVYVGEEASSARRFMAIPKRLVDRSQKLGVDLVAPALDAEKTVDRLEDALKKLAPLVAPA